MCTLLPFQNQNMLGRNELHEQRDATMKTMSDLLQQLQSMDPETHDAIRQEFLQAQAQFERLDSHTKQTTENLQNVLAKYRDYTERCVSSLYKLCSIRYESVKE
jgi:BMFP domain-containing protein YqiC